MKNSAHFRQNKRIIKKRTEGSSKEIAGLTIKILSTKFVDNPWNDDREEVTHGHYSRVFNDDSQRWELAPHPQYTVKISDGTYPAEFTFTDSINAFVTKRTAELESILACILGEAADFNNIEALDDWQGAENVMNEFGYEDLKKARDVYRALHETYLKIKPMLSENETYNLLDNELDEWR